MARKDALQIRKHPFKDTKHNKKKLNPLYVFAKVPISAYFC